MIEVLLLLALILAVLVLSVTQLPEVYPDYYCRYCNEPYHGKYALEMAEDCESVHLMEIHGKV